MIGWGALREICQARMAGKRETGVKKPWKFDFAGTWQNHQIPIVRDGLSVCGGQLMKNIS
jgi:hypothetical protein